jgi:hypothetical protein
MSFWGAVVWFQGIITMIADAFLSRYFLRAGRIVFTVRRLDVVPKKPNLLNDTIRSLLEKDELVPVLADITIYNSKMVGIALTSPELVFRCGNRELAREIPERYGLKQTRNRDQDLVWNIDARQAFRVTLVSFIEADDMVRNCRNLEVHLEVMIDGKDKHTECLGKLTV